MPGAVLAALLVLAGPAAAADAAVAVEVPAGQSKHIRLRNLPSGAVLAVRIASTGRVLVGLIGGKQLTRKKDSPKAVFRGAIERKLFFKVTIPEADDYYLVFNNRRGSEALNVEAEIRAVRGRARPPKEREGHSPRPEKASLSPSLLSISSSTRLAPAWAASARHFSPRAGWPGCARSPPV